MLINNRNLQIEIHGPEAGHPVVFLHHGLGSVRAWDGQLQTFADAGCRVIAYDRWGYGRSDPRPHLDVPGFETDLADLVETLERLNIERATLVGHSDGGTIALYYAAQHPEQIAALVTVAAHIYLEPKMEPGHLELKQAFEHKERFRKGMQEAHGEKFESTFYNWFNAWHQPETREWDMRPQLSQVQCPVLVIQGEEDEHATPQHAIDIAENITISELWLVPGANHMLPQKNSEAFNRKVLTFMGSKLHP